MTSSAKIARTENEKLGHVSRPESIQGSRTPNAQAKRTEVYGVLSAGYTPFRGLLLVCQSVKAVNQYQSALGRNNPRREGRFRA